MKNKFIGIRSMNDPDKILQAYIEQVLKIQQDKNVQSLKVEELNKIAVDLGFSQNDLQLIENKFKDFLIRGQGFSRYRNWDKAIVEFNQAVLLKPLHIEVLFGLADALRYRYLEKGKKQDKIQALQYAERCLQSAPHHEGALFLISQLANTRPRRRNREKYLRLSFILLIVIMGSLLVFLSLKVIYPKVFLSNFDEKKQNDTKLLIQQQLIKENLDIPIYILQDNKNAGLALDMESSFLKKNSEGFTYQFRGSLLSTLFEIDVLKVKLALIDERNKVVYNELLDLQEETDYEIRKGDAVPIAKIIQNKNINETVKKAQLSIEKIEKTIAPKSYDTAPALPLAWEIPKPTNLDFELRTRYQVIKPDVDIFTHEIVFEISNTGKQAIKNLQILVEWLDNNAQPIHQETIELIHLSDALLKPNQIRTKTNSYLIDIKRSDYLSFRVSVLQANGYEN